MKTAIIGAGGAGLCAGRHCVSQKIPFEIFEQTGNVGGTWNYTDCTGFDENGLPVHSSMYKGLRTNLPKEVMSYEDFPYPEQERSYLPQEEVLDYLRDYTEKFHLKPHIKFYTRVIKVEKTNDQWRLEIENVKSKKRDCFYYKAVVVCNGHHRDPFIPKIPGIDGIKGSVKHSHDYRIPNPYQNRTVLILGCGPSGIDISQQIAKVAKKVFISHSSQRKAVLGNHIHQKTLVKKIDANTAVFEDGTSEEIDDILFCTGYTYTFPFLSKNCGVQVEENHVFPLYKQIVSVENPTLAFIGLPFLVCPFPLFDIQVRFFLSILTGHFLPSKEEMLVDLEEEKRHRMDRPRRKYHQLGEEQGLYFEDLACSAKIKRVPSVIHKLYLRVREKRDLEDCFRIVDDENWEQIR